MTTPPMIYIAGPYTHPDPVINTRTAVDAGMDLYEETGCPVVIPHLSHFVHFTRPRDIDYWYAFDLRLLDHCQAIWRLEGPSTGADAEVAYAKDNDIPVFHTRLDLVRWLA